MRNLKMLPDSVCEKASTEIILIQYWPFLLHSIENFLLLNCESLLEYV